MLRRIQNLPSGVLGVEAVGRVSPRDYVEFLAPLFDAQQRSGERVRFLYLLGREFEGFTAASVVSDLRLGHRYARIFERCAVVSDVGWVRGTARFAGSFMPCPVTVWSNAELERAIAWLAQPLPDADLGMHVTDDGILVLRPRGHFALEDFHAISRVVDAWTSEHGPLRGVVVGLERVPGSEETGSFLEHMRSVRTHHPRIRRVAVAVDRDGLQLTSRLARVFADAEVRQFAFTQEPAAIAWCERT
jgi:hypothetical protein